MLFWNKFLTWIGDFCSGSHDGDDAGADFMVSSSWDSHEEIGCTVNPMTGLPMVSGNCTGVDIWGNPYGADIHLHNACFTSSTETDWIDSSSVSNYSSTDDYLSIPSFSSDIDIGKPWDD